MNQNVKKLLLVLFVGFNVEQFAMLQPTATLLSAYKVTSLGAVLVGLLQNAESADIKEIRLLSYLPLAKELEVLAGVAHSNFGKPKVSLLMSQQAFDEQKEYLARIAKKEDGKQFPGIDVRVMSEDHNAFDAWRIYRRRNGDVSSINLKEASELPFLMRAYVLYKSRNESNPGVRSIVLQEKLNRNSITCEVNSDKFERLTRKFDRLFDASSSPF